MNNKVGIIRIKFLDVYFKNFTISELKLISYLFIMKIIKYNIAYPEEIIYFILS